MKTMLILGLAALPVSIAAAVALYLIGVPLWIAIAAIPFGFIVGVFHGALCQMAGRPCK